eukprot:4933410-Amphidinium_carterae.1
MYTAGVGDMRGFWRYDMIHKEWGDTINALTSANLSNFKVALQVTVNFGGGPWGTAAFFREIQELCASYSEN